MSRRWTEASHSPSLAVIWANWRFFLMPCWCFEHSQSHPVSLHVDARGCFQWLHRGHCIFDGGAARGFGREAPPPSPISRMTSPSRTMTLTNVSARRIMARARLGRGISSRCFPRRLERRLTPPAHPRRVDRPAARAGDIGTHGRHRHVARCAPHDDPARHRPLPPRPLPPAPPPPECPI